MSTRTGYDTATPLTSQGMLQLLINDTSHHTTKFFIGRYLRDDDSKTAQEGGLRFSKQLTQQEVNLLSANGIDIVSIFELHTYDETDYDSDLGNEHAESAIERATLLHQTANTPIYFAVERNINNYDPQQQLQFKSYFDAIRSKLSNQSANPNGYKFGYYGPNKACAVVKNWYSNAYTMSAYTHTQTFTNWNLMQEQNSLTFTYQGQPFSVDIVHSKSLDYGGWQYHQFPNSWSNYNNASKHRRKCTLCNKYEYQYHVPNAAGNRCTVCNYVGNIVVPVNSTGEEAENDEQIET